MKHDYVTVHGSELLSKDSNDLWSTAMLCNVDNGRQPKFQSIPSRLLNGCTPVLRLLLGCTEPGVLFTTATLPLYLDNTICHEHTLTRHVSDRSPWSPMTLRVTSDNWTSLPWWASCEPCGLTGKCVFTLKKRWEIIMLLFTDANLLSKAVRTLGGLHYASQ